MKIIEKFKSLQFKFLFSLLILIYLDYKFIIFLFKTIIFNIQSNYIFYYFKINI
jgi:hypothetical protein